MNEEKIDLVTNEKPKKFKAKCFHCKNKEKVTLDNGVQYDLPFAYVEVKKDRKLMNECKEYVEESRNKYKNERVIKRALINYCPNCGHTINVCCKDYVDFYSKKEKKEKEND